MFLIALTIVHGIPIHEKDLIALPSDDFTSLAVPEISGLYGLPKQSIEPAVVNPFQDKTLKPLKQLNIPDGLEQIDLRSSPSENEIETQEPEKTVDSLIKPAPTLALNNQISPVLVDRVPEVPSGLYETPLRKIDVRTNVIEESQSVPIVEPIVEETEKSFLRTNEKPSGLYETPTAPSDPVPVVPSGLYETPLNLRTNEIDSDLGNSPSEPEGIIDVGIADNSFLLDNIKEDLQNLDRVVYNEIREPAVPSGLYQTPSESKHTPKIVDNFADEQEIFPSIVSNVWSGLFD